MALVREYVQAANKVGPAKRKVQIGDSVWYKESPQSTPRPARIVSFDRQYVWLSQCKGDKRTRNNTIVAESYYTIHLEDTNTTLHRVANTQVERQQHGAGIQRSA